MVNIKQYIRTVAVLLMIVVGGMMSEVWAAKITYHILTLPMNSTTGNTLAAVDGYRTEAIKTIVDNGNSVELPPHFKSPLATNFTYYASDDVTKSATSTIYANNATKFPLYQIKGGATPIAEGTSVNSDRDIYVTYEYNPDNGIAKLDGSKSYNIALADGFLAYNRGRNNRPAVIPKQYVTAEQLSSEDFVYVDVSKVKNGTINPYWAHGDNKNDQNVTGSKFHFLFKFMGEDPYNIAIYTAYAKDTSYIEKDDITKKFVRKYYKGASIFGKNYADNLFLASDRDVQYTTVYNSEEAIANPDLVEYEVKPGYYRTYNPVWNSVAMLNVTGTGTGYVFMATKTVKSDGSIDSPSKSGNDYQYYYLKSDHTNLKFAAMKSSDATKNQSTDEEMYEIKDVTFCVATPFYTAGDAAAHTVSATVKLSKYTLENDDIEIADIPEELQREYCIFNGNFYKDAAHTQKITNYSQLTEEPYRIFVGYNVTTDIPFKAIKPADSYSDATWKSATWYELTDTASTLSTGRKIKFDGSTKLQNNGGEGVYEKTSEFAFIGDPYELRVISRSQTSGATPYYIGGTTTLGVSSTASADYRWDIPKEGTDDDIFLLRKFGAEGHWYWDAASGSTEDITYSTTASTLIKTMPLPARTYIYKIVDKSGSIAVKASTSQTIFSPLSLASIPSIIVSPFLIGETVTFYDTYGGSGRGNLSGLITETPNVDHDIFVSYTTAHLDEKPIKLSEDQEFNVRLNGQYIYYDPSDDAIKTKAALTTEEQKSANYLWKLRQRDPYSMLIDNLGARTDLGVANGATETPMVYNDAGVGAEETRQVGAWVKLAGALPTTGDGTALVLDIDRASAQNFIAKSSTAGGVYEVMVATGDDVDASTTYYNIGRPGDNTVRVYRNTTYEHGDAELRFSLDQTTVYTYHLIDRAKHELLTVTSKNPDLVLPEEYQSPLVGRENYSYYALDQIDIDDSKTPKEYTPKNAGTQLVNILDLYAQYTITDSDASAYSTAGSTLTATDATDLEAQAKLLTTTGDHYFNINNGTSYKKVTVSHGYRGADIYVTYQKNDIVTFNDNSSPYLLKFLNPLAEGYFLEDGNDKLTSTKIQAVYPYCNGDGSLNIYGQPMNEEQMNGGSSTRPRWIWFFDSDNNDPYHVKIHSKSTISYKDVSHPTYLETKAIRFNQDAVDATMKHVVTCGSLPGIASTLPTEYMVLGTEHNYKLMTTDSIDDGESKKRRTVTSFEQYWKTYNMLKLHVLGIAKSTNGFSNDTTTWVMPKVDDPTTAGVDESTYRATIEARGWHSYTAIANAVRWNGYNDKSDGKEKKVVEPLEHWFQTFDMGDGTFDIESADIPPVLVLLDRHGWEIMRKPLPAKDYPYGEELKALKAYDSPMVEDYKFYSNATKATGCHKYTLRMQNGAERDPITVNGKQYTSKSLASLPPLTAKGVVSGGVIQDFFVTYTVKEEYEKSYHYECTLNEEDSTYTETATPARFLILMNKRFLRDNASGEHANYLSKPIIEGSNPSGGNAYDMILSPSQTEEADVSTPVDANKDGTIDDINMWYVKPNLEIDKEMGIVWADAKGNSNEPKTEYETREAYKDKTGFDPYNIQIKNCANGKFLTTHISTTSLNNGSFVGDYTGEGGSNQVTLEEWVNVKDSNTVIPVKVNGVTINEGYDHTNIKMTNQTFMAVSDGNDNMQLMPRFDHTKRINVASTKFWLTTLEDPVDHAKASVENNASMGPQTVLMVRPQIFEYFIVDHEGREALRYKTAGEYTPSTPDHFKSPLATDFKYYKKLTLSEGTYTEVKNNSDISEKEITATFAAAGLNDMIDTVYVRYSYNVSTDLDQDLLLQGKWFTMKLADKDVVASGTLNTPLDGTGVSLYTGTKPETVNWETATRKWQWKFLAAPVDPSSEYYGSAVDPYAVQLFNRDKNYTTNLELNPNPMGTGIKVNGTDRFALLRHPSGGYALAVTGSKTYSYSFLNGGSMTDSIVGSPVAATTALEESFTNKNGIISADAQMVVTDDVAHNYEYKVITNENIVAGVNQGSKIAATAMQNDEGAQHNNYAPYLPDAIQTPLLNTADYKYYGSANEVEEGIDTVIPATKLVTLYGLYDDLVYVRYDAYDMDKTEYEVPNMKTTVEGKVAKDPSSEDAPMNIDGGLPYNIVWENDNMMRSNDDSNSDTDGTYIKGKTGQQLQADGTNGYVWKFEGNDPYALKISNGKQGKYITAASADNGAACTLTDTPTTFMLLNKSGDDNVVLAMTGHQGSLLTMTDDSDASTLDALTITTSDPGYFIIFGLSTHKVIYHLVINTTNQLTTIPYRTGDENTYTAGSTWLETETKEIVGTTQRDLTSADHGIAGDKFQLGTTIMGQTYCVDAGEVSIGDQLKVPTEFHRPNCNFYFYVDNIQTGGATGTYQKEATDESAMNTAAAALGDVGNYYYRLGTEGSYTYKRVQVTAVSPVTYTVADCTEDDWTHLWQDDTAMNNKYKGLEVTKLMSDAGLIGTIVKVNIAYSFKTGLETNAGEGFVRSVGQNLWYTFETNVGATPYLAHYTNAWGLQAMADRATRYTNDYLWTPLGDVYGFKMYNRYMIKNSNGAANVMTMPTIEEGTNLKMAIPDGATIPNGYEVFELLSSNNDGYFRIHPVVNNTGTQYYVRKDPTDNYAKLSTTYSEWTFNLTNELLKPYVDRVGYLGGLKNTAYKAHKTVMDKVKNGTADMADMRAAQEIVYNDTSILAYTPGYYRLHNQPGVSGISPVRYASGYLHDIERTAGTGNTPIPMHFYSKQGTSTTFGTSGLSSGYTVTHATRGDIPVPATEYDPSTIFYFPGTTTLDGNPRSTMSTQGLYVRGDTIDADHGDAVMTATAGEATTFSIMDIGGAVFLIHDGSVPASRKYLHFSQSYEVSGDNKIYDLKYFHNSPTDDAKWCLQPADTLGLLVATNNGGDDYYYASFYAPYDVLLPANIGSDSIKYDAYVCDLWETIGLSPTKVPASGTHAAGKFVPAGTPFIIRTNDNTGSIKLTLPSTAPSTSLSCVFSGEYLEQLLAVDAAHDVYTMGLPFKSNVSKDDDYNETGDVVAPVPDQANSGIGFYINATPNKEAEELQSLWLRNNRYVLHNKIYYRASSSGSRKQTRSAEFVPVTFDDDDDELPGDEQQDSDSRCVTNGNIYDLQGRCVMTEQQMQQDGWQQRLPAGVYIRNGSKFVVKH